MFPLFLDIIKRQIFSLARIFSRQKTAPPSDKTISLVPSLEQARDLILAIQTDNLKVAEYLLRNGVSPNFFLVNGEIHSDPDGFDSTNQIFTSSRHLKIPTYAGSNPADACLVNGSTTMLSLLVGHGIKFNEYNFFKLLVENKNINKSKLDIFLANLAPFPPTFSFYESHLFDPKAHTFTDQQMLNLFINEVEHPSLYRYSIEIAKAVRENVNNDLSKKYEQIILRQVEPVNLSPVDRLFFFIKTFNDTSISDLPTVSQEKLIYIQASLQHLRDKEISSSLTKNQGLFLTIDGIITKDLPELIKNYRLLPPEDKNEDVLNNALDDIFQAITESRQTANTEITKKMEILGKSINQKIMKNK